MSKGESTGAIVGLRQDLRLRDNPALQAAAGHGGPIIPVYILCDAEEQEFPPGGASRWWLHRAARSFRYCTGRRSTACALRWREPARVPCSGIERRALESRRARAADGEYVRRWVPELARLEVPHIHAPDAAPAAALQAGGVQIGSTCPAPIVDLAESRRRARRLPLAMTPRKYCSRATPWTATYVPPDR
jgi:deoxyribodipyrimidine photolyase